MINLLVVEILQTTLNLHVLMLCVSEGIFDTELQRLSCDAQILNMVVLELRFPHLLLFIVNQRLLLQGLIDCEV